MPVAVAREVSGAGEVSSGTAKIVATGLMSPRNDCVSSASRSDSQIDDDNLRFVAAR